METFSILALPEALFLVRAGVSHISVLVVLKMEAQAQSSCCFCTSEVSPSAVLPASGPSPSQGLRVYQTHLTTEG